jgi:hypothetical protein
VRDPFSEPVHGAGATLGRRLSVRPVGGLTYRLFSFRFLSTATGLLGSAEQKRRRWVGASSREQFDVNATLKTGLAMSIVVVGAIVIYETFHRDSAWYGSGLAMAWGATVSWVRNLV